MLEGSFRKKTKLHDPLSAPISNTDDADSDLSGYEEIMIPAHENQVKKTRSGKVYFLGTTKSILLPFKGILKAKLCRFSFSGGPWVSPEGRAATIVTFTVFRRPFDH